MATQRANSWVARPSLTFPREDILNSILPGTSSEALVVLVVLMALLLCNLYNNAKY